MKIPASALKRAGVVRVIEQLGVADVENHGHELSAICPYCTKPDHFWISVESGAWICFKCDERGSIIRLTADLLEVDREEAIRWLRAKAGFKVTEDSAGEIRRIIGQMVDAARRDVDDLRAPVPRTARPVVHSPAAMRWLVKRGISEAVARDRDLRWCESGRWGGRVLVPIDDLDGRPLTFIARRIDDAKEKRYLHPTGPNKSRTLYAAPAGREVVVVEGVMDALRWISEGVPAAAVLGSSMSRAQSLACKRYDVVTLAFDGDDAGRKGQDRARDLLADQVPELRVVLLRDGADPGSVPAASVLPGQLVGSGGRLARRLRRRLPDTTSVSLLGDRHGGEEEGAQRQEADDQGQPR